MKFSCRAPLVLFLTALLLLSVEAGAQASGAQSDRVSVEFNVSEAEAVLAILDKKAAQRTVTDADWEKLFATEPYIRLKKREAAMHREFSDEDFRKFVVSEELQKRTPELRRTLDEWKRADLAAAARRVLPYLPADARIQPKVYPVIKPKTNSFVFEASSNPAIFLYLDPSVTREQFENTVAHEMHHIGFASIESETDARLAGLPPATKSAVEWMEAFGEGFAMLAAAGGPDVDPHATSNAKDRERWNHDMGNFATDLHTLDQFFLDILHGKFKSKEEIDQKAYTFFGTQGPWYTVGYKMAVTIEKQFGRARLIECMADVRELLPTYNQAAAEKSKKDGENLALWSPELLAALGGN
jgi:hypothetical protein